FAPEPEIRSRRHPMHRLPALLAKVDLIDVGLEDRALGKTRLDHQRIEDFLELAAEALLAREVEVAHQLLGQRAGALFHFAGTKVHPCRACDAFQVDAEMALEVSILHCL